MKALPCAVLSACLIGTVVETAPQSVSFAKPIHSPLTDQPIVGTAAADLNRDGRPDLVVAAPSTGTVYVSLASGDGAFDAPSSYVVAPGRGHVAVADFNGDAAPDIVVAAAGIAVLLGNGDGTFRAPIVSPGSATGVVVADFDGDGRSDIAGIGRNHTSGIPETVDVYPGNGDGTFGAFRTVMVSDNAPVALAVGDFNRDGRPDLTLGVRNIRQLQVYLNTGAFGFVGAGGWFIEVGPSRTAVGDLDGNGTDDVVTADFMGSVSIFFGTGDGTLADGRRFFIGDPECGPLTCPSPVWVELADLDKDGHLDVITANQQPGSASVFVNDGAGGLRAPIGLPIGAFGYAAAAADFDADGRIDVAVTNSASGNVDPGPRIVSTFLNRAKTQVERRRVRWAETSNVSARGQILQKSGGCDGCFDAFAVSIDTIDGTGDGVEFAIADPNRTLIAGLTSSFTGQMAEIDFGLLVQGGRAEVRELGVLQSAIDIGRNDTFGIWVLPDGRIAYARNGSMFHVSAAAPAFPLRFAAVFASAGGKIGNVIVIDG